MERSGPEPTGFCQAGWAGGNGMGRAPADAAECLCFGAASDTCECLWYMRTPGYFGCMRELPAVKGFIYCLLCGIAGLPATTEQRLARPLRYSIFAVLCVCIVIYICVGCVSLFSVFLCAVSSVSVPSVMRTCCARMSVACVRACGACVGGYGR